MTHGKSIAKEVCPTGHAELFTDLVCPACMESLQRHAETLECRRCEQTWPIIEGIPHFLQDFPYWGEIPLEQMREVNQRTETGPWKAALLDCPDPVVQKAAEMILNLERANWQWLVDLPAESRVLDLGAGTGTISHALALHYAEVVALEPVLERVQFMRQRFMQEKLSNVRVVRSSLWQMPFSAGSFDLITMNGVLEWVAEGQPGDPAELQQRALKTAVDLLRPGGVLYLGIENRMCPEYCIGYLDPHCRLPFVTILPRPLAQWYAKRKGRNGYRNYLYSSRGYRKLLRQAGFSRIEMYLALPSYNYPRILLPLKNNLFSYYSRNFNPVHTGWPRRIAHEMLLRLGLLKYMEDSFVILAYK